MNNLVRLNVQAVNPEKSNKIERILQAAMDAADPYAAVGRILRREGDNIVIAEKRYRPGRQGRVFVYGIGKASLAMARAVHDLLGGQIYRGAVILKHVPETYSAGNMEVLQGNHPIPGEDSLYSTRKLLLSIPDDLTEDDMVICLISGGGSALLTMPAPGIYIEELQETTRQLLACGASIHEVNTVRKHLDLLKGGGLWQKLQPAHTATLILSDVVGDDIDVIASGPMTPDTSTFEDAWKVIEHYKLDATLPKSVSGYLRARLNDHVHETLKPDSYRPDRSQVVLIGSNRIAAEAAVRQAQLDGFQTQLVTTSFIGEANQAGEILAKDAQITTNQAKKPACRIYGGETTVTLHGKGLGGRNLQTALSAVRGMSGLSETILVTMATDGEDGPTCAAGAVVTGESLGRALSAGLNPDDYLAENNSYPFFEKLGDLLVTGPSGTNVNDISLIVNF